MHGGKAPPWLFSRMKRLAGEIAAVIVEDKGATELLRRLSDPRWFQAFGCVLGYDWHSSGLTTVVTGALREALNEMDIGVKVAGGKGKKALEALEDIGRLGEELGLTSSRLNELKYASRMAAKVDNVALQDGYVLYHHSMVFTERGEWVVIQQGMDISSKYARRYHWLSEKVYSFVEEPHSGIISARAGGRVLNMVAKESEGARKVSVDLVKEGLTRLKRLLKSLRGAGNLTLARWTGGSGPSEIPPSYLFMPKRVDWEALKRAYEFQPSNYEELLSVRGIGGAVVRGLALISQLIYGEPPSWADPAKFSFAFGGKDGVPYPVDVKAMDRAIAYLREAIEAAEVGMREKLEALRRLSALAPD